MSALLPDSSERAAPRNLAGTLHGVGLGPGDPELMTVRAIRLIRAAGVVAWFAKRGRTGNARTIIEGLLPSNAEQIALEYPMTTEAHFESAEYVSALSAFYDDAAAALAARLSCGSDVLLVSEGDPFFYGSFMHVYIRLKDRFRVTVTPGVTGMAACWATSREPITWGDDVLCVLPATLSEAELTRRLSDADAAVVMKLGGNCAKVRRAIEGAGLVDRAIYVERGSMPGEVVQPLAARATDDAPYFSMILVPGKGRRP
ncbi:MAG: precorrin-2 C(20)-methyltransferase [Leifsonia xyli]|nr:MAG: precorrin-2 C(20)-methyltransferase [Leifsonia xyli]